MDKKAKKIIVNSITFTRILGTISMPIMCNFLSSTAFLLVIAIILLTDLIDGKLARKWEVSTVFGSLLDMGADKLFGIALMSVLALTYPIFIVPLCLELAIGQVNLENVLKGNIAKSKWTGKVKMVIVGLSMTSLLMIGASPEISNFLSNANIDVNLFKDLFEKNNIDSNILKGIAMGLDNVLSFIKEKSVDFTKIITDFFSNNKNIIENVVIPATITSEVITLADYQKDTKKVKNNERKKLIEELKKYKEYIKEYGPKKYKEEILFNKEYYDETINEPLVKKLMPNKNKVVDK